MEFEQQPENEIYAKEYEEAKKHLRDIFLSRDQEKIDEMYSQIRSFAGIAGLDPESTIEQIKKALDLESPDEFVDVAFEVTKKIVDQKIEQPKIFGDIQRERIVQKPGNIQLSELMYYDIDPEDGTARIHVAEGTGLGLGEIIKSFRDGLRELARQVKEDERIKGIQAGSWIVAKNPGLLEKAGFVVDGPISDEIRAKYFKNEEGLISSAYISRENLLEKYLNN